MVETPSMEEVVEAAVRLGFNPHLPPRMNAWQLGNLVSKWGLKPASFKEKVDMAKSKNLAMSTLVWQPQVGPK